MFKSNLSSNPMLPSKKRPVLFKETADDTPPSTPVPKDPFINPANSNTYDSAGIGTRTDLERKIGAIPSSVNERFQWYLENNKNQGDKTARSNNIILDSVHNIKYPSILPKIPGQTKQNSNNGATNGNKPASPVQAVEKLVFRRDNHVLPLALRSPGRQNARRNRPYWAFRCVGSTDAAGNNGLRVATLNNPKDFFDSLRERRKNSAPVRLLFPLLLV